MSTARALRLSVDDVDAFAVAEDWSRRDRRPDLFAVGAHAAYRMTTVAEIAELGLPIYREANLPLDRGHDEFEWITETLVAPAGPFRYISVAASAQLVDDLVPEFVRAAIPVDSIVVSVHPDPARTPAKQFRTFVGHLASLGVTQLRTDSVACEWAGDALAPFSIWLDDHTEAHHGRGLDAATARATVMVLDPESPLWS